MSMQHLDRTTVRLILGLGNPGAAYAQTRHNIGFRVAEALADFWGGTWRKTGNMEVAEVRPTWASSTIFIVKPQTFMNASGSVLTAFTKKGIEPAHIVVAHDEVEKSFGSISLRFGGSAKGHNGLKSIIQTIGPDFWRLRYGVGRPSGPRDISSYVLERFSPTEEAAVRERLAQVGPLFEASNVYIAGDITLP